MARSRWIRPDRPANRGSTIRGPRIEVICVGTELLTGKVNTHTAYLGPKLAEIGLSLSREHAVGDDADLMRETFSEVYRRADVILCAGGLGPTFDDITRDTWSRVLKRPMKIHPLLVKDIREKFRSRGLSMPPKNRRQAMVLQGADVIMNAVGTAPGQLLKTGKKILALLPGPSRELYPMIERVIVPQLRDAYPGHHLVQKTFQIFGLTESRVDEIIRPWVARRARFGGCRITHGILASQSVISVKFTVEGPSMLDVRSAAVALSNDVKQFLKHLIFGEGDATLEQAVGNLLRSKRKTLAVAESCTGGTITKLMTENSGASDYFLEGVVTYSNASKQRRLGVSKKTLDRYGAVSAQVAKEMAEGLRKVTKADYTLSVTGIAGPTGGTAQKPVGLVFIGLANSSKTIVKKFQFTGERGLIRHRAALNALHLLRLDLIK